MTNEMKAAALHLSCAVGHLDAVLSMEPEKSARWNRLNNSIERINKDIDLYRLSAFSYQDMQNAAAVLDAVNEMIEGFYPAEEK